MLRKLCLLMLGYAALPCHAAGDQVDYQLSPNLTYAHASGTDLKLDVYARQGSGPQPVLIFIHGGGWLDGTKELSSGVAQHYLPLGFSVVNIEYRMSRTALAPAAVEDTLCALDWVGRHAQQYNFDLSKVVVAGESAGGHLALSAGLMPADSPFRQACATPGAGASAAPAVAAVINWYGISDVSDQLAGPNQRTYAVRWFGDVPDQDALARRLSPLTYVRPGARLPPVLSIHGDADPVVPYQQSVRLQQALDAAAINNELLTIPGGVHGRFTEEQNARAYQAIRRFLAENGVLPPDDAN